MPGFFGDQADRLLRKKWDDPYELAQELWAMFNADVPMTTDQPIVVRRNADDQAAVRIIDNTAGTSSPIIVNKTDGEESDQPNIDSDGDYRCCGSGGQNGSDGPADDEPSNGGSPPADPGTISPQPPPSDPNTPYRLFFGTVRIKINQGEPDPSHWNGQQPTFTATGCFPYKPPLIPAPTDAYDERFNSPDGSINQQIQEFMASHNLDGFETIGNSVSGPGGPCT